MKYYLDTEFIDDGSTVDLISIGIVAEDGREYYAQSCEFKPENASPWVDQNVLPHLTMCYGPDSDHSHDILESRVVHCQGKCNLYEVHNMPDVCPWRTREQIRDEIHHFLWSDVHPELYGWCSGYDWVAFCQLFGTMMQLPKGYPHYIQDLQQVLDEYGILDSDLPQQEKGLHNALEDARHIKYLWEYVGNYTSKLMEPILPPYEG